MNTGPFILFRCDGSPEIGLGHVVRCLALADELSQVQGFSIAFAMREGHLGFELVKKKNYLLLTPLQNSHQLNYNRWLVESIRKTSAKALVLDVRDGLSRNDVDSIRKENILVVTLDDQSERRLAADLAFYPPIPQINSMDWTDFRGELFVGWKWVVLRREFVQLRNKLEQSSSILLSSTPPKILVTMGGSDPKGMTLNVIKALYKINEEFEALIVLGPGFSHRYALKGLLTNSIRSIKLYENVTNMHELMAQADLAVASFGVTAYELAAIGVPAIYLCLTKDHVESATAFVNAGIAVCVGVFNELIENSLTKEIPLLLTDVTRRKNMVKRARQLVDGLGTKRISRIIAERLKIAYGQD